MTELVLVGALRHLSSRNVRALAHVGSVVAPMQVES